jgi:hypothetical protein
MKKFAGIVVFAALAAGCATTPNNNSDREPASNHHNGNGGEGNQNNDANAQEEANGFQQLRLNAEGQSSGVLTKCNTTVRLERDRNTNTLNLIVDNVAGQVSHCSNVWMQGADGQYVRVGKIAGGTAQEKIALGERYGQNTFKVKLESDKKKTAGEIEISSYVPKPKPKPQVEKISPNEPADFTLSNYVFGRRFAELGDCGGSVYMHVENGAVKLDFSNVAHCSNFDILSDNGSQTLFKDQKIEGTEGNRSDTKEIPRELYQSGANTIKVVVRSGTSKTFDVFRIMFLAY